MDNKNKLDEIFVNQLEIAPDQLENLTYQSVPLWDSVGHMSLVAALEDAFEIMLETEDIIDLSSYKKAFEILGKYGVKF